MLQKKSFNADDYDDGDDDDDDIIISIHKLVDGIGLYSDFFLLSS